jgi:DNA polymerase-3 subunit beta
LLHCRGIICHFARPGLGVHAPTHGADRPCKPSLTRQNLNGRRPKRRPKPSGSQTMRVTLERSNLLKSLNHVHRVVERRNTIPILSNVLLESRRRDA